MLRFANNFHSWLRHSWKLLANRLTRDPKIVIHGNSCIILYISWFSVNEQVRNIGIVMIKKYNVCTLYSTRQSTSTFFNFPASYFMQQIDEWHRNHNGLIDPPETCQYYPHNTYESGLGLSTQYTIICWQTLLMATGRHTGPRLVCVPMI